MHARLRFFGVIVDRDRRAAPGTEPPQETFNAREIRPGRAGRTRRRRKFCASSVSGMGEEDRRLARMSAPAGSSRTRPACWKRLGHRLVSHVAGNGWRPSRPAQPDAVRAHKLAQSLSSEMQWALSGWAGLELAAPFVTAVPVMPGRHRFQRAGRRATTGSDAKPRPARGQGGRADRVPRALRVLAFAPARVPRAAGCRVRRRSMPTCARSAAAAKKPRARTPGADPCLTSNSNAHPKRANSGRGRLFQLPRRTRRYIRPQPRRPRRAGTRAPHGGDGSEAPADLARPTSTSISRFSRIRKVMWGRSKLRWRRSAQNQPQRSRQGGGG